MQRLTSYIDNYKKVKVLVIGDIMLDRFVYGSVKRISPEAPVPILKAMEEKLVLGGAGNVAANLVALGCQTVFAGVIGKDKWGKKLSELLTEAGVNAYLLKLENYPTIVKTRLISNGNHMLRVDEEEKLSFETDILPRFKKILVHLIKKADIVLLSDYDKGLLTSVTAKMIIDVCRNIKKKIIVDPKGGDYSKYVGATLVKPNLKEFAEATGRTYDPKSPDFHQAVSEGAAILFKKYQIENLIITLSEYGMLHVGADDVKKISHIPTEVREVFDVVGAGDTALAALGASLGSGLSYPEAMKMANLAAGIVVEKVGTATVTAVELKHKLSEKTDYSWHQKNKIITLEEAVSIIQGLKKKGKKIGFTNGCFDCCHLGHLTSFMRTKELCDILVVGLNGDQWIKSHKGPNRPIQDEATRSLLLASMEFIDYIILFNDETPLPIIDKIRPDIVAKEGYTLDKWPEGRFVKDYGGEAVILKRVEGYSTSDLVKKMKG